MKDWDFENTGDAGEPQLPQTPEMPAGEPDVEYGRELFPEDEPELLADELAVEGHGLLHPDEQELDAILREVKAMDAEEEPGEVPALSADNQEYSDLYEEEPADELLEGYGKTVKKRRRRSRPRRKKIKKKGSGLLGIPHFIGGLLVIAMALVLGVTLARIMWLWADDVLALTKDDREVTLVITENDTLEDIAGKLERAGLVRYPGLFKFYCQVSDSREKISAGEFTLNEMLDYHALVGHMSSGSSARKEITVTIPEGYECRQIFALLEKNGVCTVEALEHAAMTMDISGYWFLEMVTDRENPYCLEGFLFPDTYKFYMYDKPERVIKKFLRNFDNRFSQEMEEGLAELNAAYATKLASFGYDQTYIDSQELTIFEVVTVAAMIERETAGSGESATIASVIYNRLANPNYPYLNIDATIQYALEEHKAELTYEDLKIDSPYNTYLYTGLPIGPISNPGLSSLKAAIWPENTSYYYYALDTDGLHHFSKNAQEHEEFLESLKGDD